MRKDVVYETFILQLQCYNANSCILIGHYHISIYAQSSISIDILSVKGLSCFMIPCLLRGGQTDQSYTS